MFTPYKEHHYINSKAENVQRFKSDKAEVYGYTYSVHGTVCAVLYTYKGKKPLMNYRYRNDNQRIISVTNAINNRISHKEHVAKRRAEQNKPNELKVGDILYSSWGYDQTNIDFFKVTKILGKRKIEIVEVGSKLTPSGHCSMSGYVTADINNYRGAPFEKMVTNGKTVKISSCAHAHPWDGKPKLKSWYA